MNNSCGTVFCGCPGEVVPVVVIIESLFSMASKENVCIWFFKVMLITIPWQVYLEYGEPRKSVFIKLL
jgi:hypothetical protein